MLRFQIDSEVVAKALELCGIQVWQWIVNEDGVFEGCLASNESDDTVVDASCKLDQFRRTALVQRDGET